MSFFPDFADSIERYCKVDGVMIGIVTNNDDPEKLGRVKVKLPIREGEDETDWVRVATFMGGSEMGSFFIPEVNDEVLVAFHLGEISQPFVIGCLWNETQKPPVSMENGNHIRMLKTRSGHVVTFDDNENGSIEIKTKVGQVIKLDDKEKNITISDNTKKHTIDISGGSKNEITIKSNNSVVKINGKGEISIESPTSIKVKSTQVNIEASASLGIKAGASLDVKCDGIINIKGSLVKIN